MFAGSHLLLPTTSNCITTLFASSLSRPLSLVGRINLCKMVILPKFLYLFQHIAIFINNFFMGFDGILHSFLWGNKPAHLRNTYGYLPKALHFQTSSNITGPATLINFSFETGIAVHHGCIQKHCLRVHLTLLFVLNFL